MRYAGVAIYSQLAFLFGARRSRLQFSKLMVNFDCDAFTDLGEVGAFNEDAELLNMIRDALMG
jgi:hypothetical protein